MECMKVKLLRKIFEMATTNSESHYT
jgi:hypothetical protein